ncbi:Protein of unknown function [Pyronema omphalodes CBS 100304]|uniref:Uncharacterized protein n=1 Tax=Pyronema omphalodes (strain CBS 100304) TaxID=1076935 RepID=U4LAB5_PYROM|nr:Protein of unknown function [Pyronema omphalodes CBS 100304]
MDRSLQSHKSQVHDRQVSLYHDIRYLHIRCSLGIRLKNIATRETDSKKRLKHERAQRIDPNGNPTFFA